MKQALRSFLLVAVIAALLLTVIPFSAFAYGSVTVPADGEVHATGMMAPLNENASQACKNLLAYLQTLNNTNRFVTGTFDISNSNQVYDLIHDQFGVETGLYSNRYFVQTDEAHMFDFNRVNETNTLLKEHYDNGNILLVHNDTVVEDKTRDYLVSIGELPAGSSAPDMCAHLDATNPDRNMVAYARYQHFLEENIAALTDLENRGVDAYMYRPWVEMSRFNFNGVTLTGYEHFRNVFRQTTEYFRKSSLKGYLITYAPTDCNSKEYYPGSDYVDVLAPTVYAPLGNDGRLLGEQFSDYSWMSLTGKPIGLSETSCRSGDWTKMAAEGRKSCYATLISMVSNFPMIDFVDFWGDGSYSLVDNTGGSKAAGNNDGYWYVTSPFSITLDQLPDYRNTTIGAPGVAQLYSTKYYGGNSATNYVNNYVGLEEKAYSKADLQKLGIDPAKVASFNISKGYVVIFYPGDNCTGTPWNYIKGMGDSTGEVFYGKAQSLKVTRPAVVSLEQEVYANDDDDSAWKVVDGRVGTWSGHTDPETGNAWLVMCMDKTYEISRWAVRHGAASTFISEYNTVDFCLQYSIDGSVWKTVQWVKGNAMNVTDNSLDTPVTARYFRLLITKPNTITAGSDVDMATVAEWELYGLESTTQYDEVEDLDELLYNTPSDFDQPKLPAGPTLYNYNGTWVYVVDGAIATGYTGLVNYGGTYYYVNKGYVDWNTETLVNYSNAWWHVKGGKVVFDTTLVNYGSSWYYVVGGKVDFNATGLCNYGGTYYFVNKGVVDFKTETLVNYGGSWWHVKGGKVVFDTTLVNYGGNWYYVGGGKVNFGATGLCNYGGTYYYVNKGVVDFKTETLVNYGGSWWHVKGGKVVFDTTLVKYGNTWYYVQGGKVNFSASGKFNYYGTNYNVKNGIVVF